MLHSPSASFTVKHKKVKFVENDEQGNEGDEAKGTNLTTKGVSRANDDIVEFTVHVPPKKARPTGADASKNEDYQSRIKELSQELTKSKEKIDILEMKNKELESMVSHCMNGQSIKLLCI